MTIQPEFVHDCEECVYLGTIRRQETILVPDEHASALTAGIEKPSIADLDRATGAAPCEVYDLYCCDKLGSQTLGPSLIARFGNDGPAYKSLLAWYASNDPDIAVAFRIADGAGLLPNKRGPR